MQLETSRIWKVAGLGLLGFCAISVAADRVNLGPIASEVAGFCGAFLGALAGRRSNQQREKSASGTLAERASETPKKLQAKGSLDGPNERTSVIENSETRTSL
jgi:hypothetical protein